MAWADTMLLLESDVSGRPSNKQLGTTFGLLYRDTKGDRYLLFGTIIRRSSRWFEKGEAKGSRPPVVSFEISFG